VRRGPRASTVRWRRNGIQPRDVATDREIGIPAGDTAIRRRMTARVDTLARRSLFCYENWLVLILGLTFGFVFFDRSALNFLTPFIVADLKLSNTQLGLLSSGLAVTWALSAYLIGRWSDSRGVRKPFLLTFTIVFSLCSFLSGLAPNFLVLLASRVLMGVAEGPFLPVCLAVVNAESSPHRRGINAGFMQVFFGTLLAGVVAPLVMVALATRFNWRAAFCLAGVPGLVCAVAIWRWVREPVASELSGPSKSGGVAYTPPIEFLQMLRVRNIWLCCLISICMVGQLIVGLTFLPLFLTSVRHFSPTTMSWIMSVAGAAGPLGFLVPGVSDRLGRKPIVIGFSCSAVLVPLAALYFRGSPGLLATLIFVGNLSSGIFPLFMGIIPSETISRRYAATAMGLIVCVGELVGGFAAPILAGWIADRTSLAAPLMVTGVLVLTSGLLACFLKETAPAKIRAKAG
jgi:MFS transporter, ACS family, hexuronate transporter